MRAMILAAGLGARMGELTQHTPKPMLKVNGKPLIEYTLESLKASGITEVVVNLFYLGDQIKAFIGDGSRYGLKVAYSEEVERLETGGGILQALPLLGNEPFIVTSSDIVTDYPFSKLPTQLKGLAHLVMVDNPAHHVKGDFCLDEGLVTLDGQSTLTYSNLGVFHPDLFQSCEPGFFPLSKLLFPAIRNRQVTGEYFDGSWENIGTPEQIEALDRVCE